MGSEGIAIARIRREEGQTPQLEACRYLPLEAGADAAMVLEGLVSELGIEHGRSVVVMQPDSHSLLLIEAPDVQPAELKAAVRWRIKDLIDFHIDDAVIDVFEIPEQGAAPGKARLMYAVAARASTIHSQIKALEKTSLDLEIIDIPELAIRNIAALLDEDIRGTAFLYFGQRGGVITLTRQGSLYLSRNIDVGLQQMVTANGNDGEIHPQTQQALERIALEVQRSLDYYESHFSQPPINSLVLAPLAREIPGVIPYLSANLGMAVSVLDLNSVLETNDNIDSATQAHCLTAIGAALRLQQKVL
ncbi:pilus assembly protein PilM [Sulfuriflexus sp.]|uniref:pilus assembly protein PilM n=1 Tax=Sulfuriflexus sp. TaxID=2015443 RepID=UPI0028CE42EE|nr:pilus assembly protein PilM [Sulfuriflexus sp.]MDT8403549.1 pilus assembly protein PilM [Sulfuriflexus sp.]